MDITELEKVIFLSFITFNKNPHRVYGTLITLCATTLEDKKQFLSPGFSSALDFQGSPHHFMVSDAHEPREKWQNRTSNEAYLLTPKAGYNQLLFKFFCLYLIIRKGRRPLALNCSTGSSMAACLAVNSSIVFPDSTVARK
jgi:hypothetical protein